MNHMKYVIGFAAFSAAIFPCAFAQDTIEQTAAVTSEDGIETFRSDWFAAYNPVTAFDMVSRIPGFEIDDGETRRGFGGTAGNVLVNGERPSSKTVVSEQLKRIPAGSVERIELISGGAGNFDVRGQTQLVNVVLGETAEGGSPTTFVLELRDIQFSKRLGWTVQLTKTFALNDKADLTLDFQTPNLRGRTESVEMTRDPSGAITGRRETHGQPNNIELLGSAVLNWRPTGQDTINFNAEYNPKWHTLDVGVQIENPDRDYLASVAGRKEQENHYSAEFGGDWEHRFSPELSVKLIGLLSQNNNESTDVYRTFTNASVLAGGPANIQRIDQETSRGERVARGVVMWEALPGHTLDFGLEGAFNFRDTTLNITNDRGAGPVAQPLAVANARVEEVRFEPFITDVWTIAPGLTLESGLVWEFSKITQTGDETKEREFSYAKPRFIATWQASPSDQIRASIERDISQLDFSQFATAVNVVDAFSIVGNPDLEPEKTWKLRAEWERRFGDFGAITLSAFHDEVEDVEDFVAIGSNDAYGNIGDGTRTGLELQGTTRLSALIPNSELRYSGLWQETKVTDPITGETRRFAGEQDWEYDVSFRQELPSINSAWEMSLSRDSDTVEFKRLEDIHSERSGSEVELFAETTLIEGITVRATARNIFHPHEDRTRTFYAGVPGNPSIPPRSTGQIFEVDERKLQGGPGGTQVFSIRISGTF